MLNALSLLIAQGASHRPPSFLVAIEPSQANRREADISSYRLVLKGGRLVPVFQARLPFRGRGPGYTLTYPGDGGKLVFQHHTYTEPTPTERIEVWSASPLRLLSEIRCPDNSFVSWLPGLDALAIVEHAPVGYRVRIVRSDGTSVVSLKGTLAAFADPKARAVWLVRSSLPDASARSLFVTSDFGAGIISALAKKSIWLERLDAPFRRAPVRVPTLTGLRRLLGPDPAAADLSFLVQSQRSVRGFARNWAYSEGPFQVAWTKDGRGLYGTALGYPRRRARLATFASDGDAAFSTTLDGALVYAARLGAVPGDPGDVSGYVGVWMDGKRRETWRVPFRTSLGVLLWK